MRELLNFIKFMLVSGDNYQQQISDTVLSIIINKLCTINAGLPLLKKQKKTSLNLRVNLKKTIVKYDRNI